MTDDEIAEALAELPLIEPRPLCDNFTPPAWTNVPNGQFVCSRCFHHQNEHIRSTLAKPEIREATIADLPRVVAMFSEFVASTQYAQYVGNDPSYSAQQMGRMMESESCVLFVVDLDGAIIGMLGAMVFQQPFSGELVASELFWWLDPQHRGHGVWLLRRAERWAMSKGAARMTMMAPVDKPRVAEIYQTVGYHAVETVFSRNLP